MIKNLTVGRRIAGGFLLVLVLLIGIGIASLSAVNSSSEGFNSFEELSSRSGEVSKFQTELLILNSAVSDYMIYKSQAQRDEYEKYDQSTIEFLENIQPLLAGTSHESKFQELKEKRLAYQATTNQILDLIQKEVGIVNNSLNPAGSKTARYSKQLFDKLSLDNVVTGMRNSASAIRKYLLGRYYVGQMIIFADEKNLKRARDEFSGLKQILGTLESNVTSSSHKSRLKKFKESFAKYDQAVEEVQAVVFERDRLVQSQLKALAPQMQIAAQALIESIRSEQTSFGQQLATLNKSAQTGVLTGVIISCLLGLLMAFLITRSIVRPLNRSISQLYSSMAEVMGAAKYIEGSSQSLARGTGAQALSVQETSKNLAHISTVAQENVDTAENAQSLSRESKTCVDQCVGKMGEMSSAMDAIKNSSQEVSDIVRIIDDIAFQTNLLALNAAVEAARAGDAGKGFAVVAEEVRSLAQRSADAAKESSEKIGACVSNSEEGVRVSEEVSEQLTTIAESTSKMDELLNSINQGSNEQSSGVQLITNSVKEISAVTQESSAGAEESAAAASELMSQAESVRTVAEGLSLLVRGNTDQETPEPATGQDGDHDQSSSLEDFEADYSTDQQENEGWGMVQ